MEEQIEKYRQVFQIPKNLQIELEEIDKGQELIYIPEENKAIFRLDQHSIRDIPELMAQLKLGIDYHPLLATMYFQKDLSEEEENYAGNFYMLIIPLLDAWVWKAMKEYLPEEEMEKQVKQLKELWERAQLSKMYFGDRIKESELMRRRMSVSQYFIFKALGYEAELKLIGKGKHLQEWVRYKKILEKMIHHTPNIDDFVKLPQLTKAPFTVSVKEKPYPHFVVKKK
ncbi:hypothetical protein [Persephonella sp.]